MKALLFLPLFLVSLALAEEAPVIPLTWREENPDDYPAQIGRAFSTLLTSTPELAKKFAAFESAPPEEERGRYSGEPQVAPLTLNREEEITWEDDVAVSNFTQTVALFYRFEEGTRRGMYTRSGFFALFEVTGQVKQREKEGAAMETLESKVTARFTGFHRDLKVAEPKTD